MVVVNPWTSQCAALRPQLHATILQRVPFKQSACHIYEASLVADGEGREEGHCPAQESPENFATCPS